MRKTEKRIKSNSEGEKQLWSLSSKNLDRFFGLQPAAPWWLPWQLDTTAFVQPIWKHHDHLHKQIWKERSTAAPFDLFGNFLQKKSMVYPASHLQHNIDDMQLVLRTLKISQTSLQIKPHNRAKIKLNTTLCLMTHYWSLLSTLHGKDAEMFELDLSLGSPREPWNKSWKLPSVSCLKRQARTLTEKS